MFIDLLGLSWRDRLVGYQQQESSFLCMADRSSLPYFSIRFKGVKVKITG